MKPEKCPACGGYCCEDYARRWRPSLRYGHGWPNEHTCPDCSDGHAPVPKPPERTAEAERAAVVAWLRREVDDDDNAGGPLAYILAYAAAAIERGEHRREETK